MSVILDVDADHLDYFKNLDNIVKSFHQFALQTSGWLVYNGDDANTHCAPSRGIENAKPVSFGESEGCDYRAVRIEDCKGAREAFDIERRGEDLCHVELSIPGRHNIYNALAAFAVCDILGVPVETLQKSLHAFTGVHRRFEILGKFGGITVADDFAHHPTELTATLSAAMHMGFHAVWAIFQPQHVQPHGDAPRRLLPKR